MIRKGGYLISLFHFYCNGVIHKSFRTTGFPIIKGPLQKGCIIIGDKFAMNNKMIGNPIGYNNSCLFVVDKDCKIIIGENVGISQCTLVAKKANVIIKNNVKIGGGTKIYTSDFHSLDANNRRSKEDTQLCKSGTIIIENDVFIGAGCLILKGVTIGESSIIGAGSVVTKSIPSKEIWAGNPAKFIKRVV